MKARKSEAGKKGLHFSSRRVGLALLVVFYLFSLLGGFIAPYNFRAQSRQTPFVPPVRIHFIDEQGGFHLRPFIYRPKLIDPLNFGYDEDRSQRYPVQFFARGEDYELFGLFTSTLHLLGVEGGASAPRLHLLGTDGLGRDLLARMLYGGQVSLLVGPLGLLVAYLIGVALGAAAGYYGGAIDALLMRAADVMMSLPSLLLILALRAAFPLSVTPLQVAMMMLVIFAVVGWAEVARLARGLVAAERQRDYVAAAISSGARDSRIVTRHILPNVSTPLLTQFAISAPSFILAEIALSYLGVGVQEPSASWGTLLADASEISVLKNYLWMLTPALFVFLTALAFHLLGENTSGVELQER
ncbi:MAG TPA: ABC transporter permease [Blastocatellia bacterium]|nr:ABC transporter permease [Blastocatellia bacterium]